MKQSAARTRSLLLLTGAALAVLVLLLWSGGGGQTARAYPGLTAGMDMNPATTTDTNGDGKYESVDLGVFESCRDVSLNDVITVDVFVLDVTDLVAFSANLDYNSSVVDITGVDTDLFMGAQPGSSVFDLSEPIPPTTPGFYETAAIDESNQGDDGSGVLARLTVQAIAGGVSPFSLDIDPAMTHGVTLKDVSNQPLGDTDGDSLFDGPFINAGSSIAVGQDNDNDGYRDFACPGQPVDNCPNVYNPSQSDVDGDSLGDECDYWDADGDGHTNTYETTYGSLPLNAASRPEVCDGVDNDLNDGIDEGFDYSRPNSGIPSTGAPNGIPDCTEDVHSDSDGTANPSDADDDNDETLDTAENVIATDSLIDCTNGTGLPDWPPDFIGSNKTINILDIVQLTPPVFGSTLAPGGKQPYERRKDLLPDAVINILDIVRMTPPVFGSTCS